jgi:hypothetical protein
MVVQRIACQSAFRGGPDVTVFGGDGQGKDAPSSQSFQWAIVFPGVSIEYGQPVEGSSPKSSLSISAEGVNIIAAEAVFGVLGGELCPSAAVPAPDAVAFGGGVCVSVMVGTKSSNESALRGAVPRGRCVSGSRQRAEHHSHHQQAKTDDQAREQGRENKGAVT